MFVCCKAVGVSVEGCGKACGFACTSFGDCLCPNDRPTPIFVLFSCVVNVIGAILSFIGLVSGESGCGKVPLYLGINLVVCAVHIVFSFYFYRRFTRMLQEGKGAFSGGVQILLFDLGVYLYLFAWIFAVVWTVMGSIWAGDLFDLQCPSSRRSAYSAITCSWVYIGLGLFIMFCSMCTECCRTPKWKQHQQQQHPTGNPVHQPFISPAVATAPPAGYPAPPQGQPVYPQQQQQQQVYSPQHQPQQQYNNTQQFPYPQPQKQPAAYPSAPTGYPSPPQQQPYGQPPLQQQQPYPTPYQNQGPYVTQPPRY